MRLIRDACFSDAARLSEIYAYYVDHTAVSFEYDAPSEDDFRCRIESISGKYPFLVCEEEGDIQGYAYASHFKERRAYDISCETSIYIDREKRGLGYGRLLYEELENSLQAMGIQNLYACVAVPAAEDDAYLDFSSVNFHEHMGFRTVGHFRSCAVKFGRFYDMVYMERPIRT